MALITDSVYCPECCGGGGGGGCCMYRAEFFGTLFDASDLPDEIEVWNSDNGLKGPFILSHNGDGTYGTLTPPPFTGHYVYYSLGQWSYARSGGAGVTDCLMLGEYGETPNAEEVGRGWMFDRFADTYTLSSGIAGGFTTTVTRQSLCEWIGTVMGDGPVQVGVKYFDYALDFSNDPNGVLIPPQWVAYYANASTFKYDLSSPEGTYVDPDGILVDNFYVTQ